MKHILIKAILKWGTIAAIVAILTDVAGKYTLCEAGRGVKYALVLFTLVAIVACIYAGIREYRGKKAEASVFTFTDGLKVSALVVLCYGVVFSLYFVVLTQCVDTQLISRYKQQQIQQIEQSSKSVADREQAILGIQNATLVSLLVGNFLQSMIFPFTVALFLSVGMQRKKPVTEHNMDNKDNQELNNTI